MSGCVEIVNLNSIFSNYTGNMSYEKALNIAKDAMPVQCHYAQCKEQKDFDSVEEEN